MSTMPVVLSQRSTSRSIIRTSVVVAVATAFAAAVVFLFALPGAARADETVAALTRYDQTDEHIDYVGTWDTFEKTAAYKTAYARANTAREPRSPSTSTVRASIGSP